MHPRLMIQASCAASRTTISSAVRPDGKESSTVSIHSGRDVGARFWKKASPSAPLTNRLRAMGTRDPTQGSFGDRHVIADQIELGVAALREEDLVGIADRDRPPGDFQDLIFRR